MFWFLMPALCPIGLQREGNIRIPGLLHRCKAKVVQVRLTRPTIAGEEIHIFCPGHDYSCRKASDLAGHAHLTNKSTVLTFCRFMTGCDSGLLLDESLREVIRIGDANKVFFRVPFDRKWWTSGFDGIVSKADFRKLHVASPVVRKESNGWVVVRICIGGTGDLLQMIEEHVSVNGTYTRKLRKSWKPPATVSWSREYPEE